MAERAFTAKGQRHARPKTGTWEAGRYVLLGDRYLSPSDQRESARATSWR